MASRAPYAAHRQLTALDAGGGGAFTGEAALGVHGHRVAEDCVVAGNLLASEEVLDALADAFAGSDGHLGQRLVDALASGREADPVRSAGLLLAGEVPWPVADLRVDWHDEPVAELRALWAVWEPQLDDYVTRALNPEGAPSFGVAGDEA